MANRIKCKACGAAMSKYVPTCPKCGKPKKSKKVGLVFAIVFLIFALVGGVALFSNYDTDTRPEPKPAIAVDCSTQAEREQFVTGMIDRGYWASVQYTTDAARLKVMPFFMTSLTFDEQQQFVNVAAAANQCNGGEFFVRLIDAMTDNAIGFYSKTGLVLDG